MRVKITDIVEGLESSFGEMQSMLDKQTGEVIGIREGVLGRAEEDEESGELAGGWEWEEFEQAKLVVENPDRFIDLPSKFDLHEWQIMADFAERVSRENVRRDLQNAIHAAGAFRNF